MWKQRAGSMGSSAGSRDSRDASDVPYSELLPLFRRRQLAHAHDEELRRGSGHEPGWASEVPSATQLCCSALHGLTT